jgi:5'-3' exonuclease
MDAPLMLLDSASLWFRAFYGVPATLTAEDGTPVNAARGFCDMVARLVRERRPGGVVACLDRDWRPAFRVRALPSYKAHRVDPSAGDPSSPVGGAPDAEAAPPELGPQVDIILEVLAAIGIPTAGAEGFEADDVIGTLAARERVDPVLAVSGDRDLMQIVTDGQPPVRLLYVGRGLAKAELLGPAEVAEKYGVPRARAGAAYAEMAMLRGDPSDGLPGVPGIGAKTAATIVGRYDTWSDLLGAVADPTDSRMSPNVRSKLAKAGDYLAVVEPVVRVAQDADVVLDRDDTLPVEPADGARLLELVERWGIASSVERLLQALQTAAKSR